MEENNPNIYIVIDSELPATAQERDPKVINSSVNAWAQCE